MTVVEAMAAVEMEAVAEMEAAETEVEEMEEVIISNIY